MVSSSRKDTRCLFGPIDFTIGIMSGFDERICAYGVNRDVLTSLSEKLDAEIQSQERLRGRRIFDLYIPLEESKSMLLESFVVFLNQGRVVTPHFRNSTEADSMLFLYNFAGAMRCDLLKFSVVRSVKWKMRGIVQELKIESTKRGYPLDSEIMEWMNCFYECSTEKEMEENKLWEMVEKALGGYPAAMSKLSEVKIDKDWDEKFKKQISERISQHQANNLPVKYVDIHNIRSCQEPVETETETEDEAYCASTDGGEDFYMDHIDEVSDDVAEIRDRLSVIGLADININEDIQQ